MSDPTSYLNTVTISMPGTYTFKWTITFSPNIVCNAITYSEGSDLITVNITGPTLTISATATSICPGTPVTLTANGNGVSWKWNDGTTGKTKVVSPTSTTTYSVTSYDGLLQTGCKAFSSITISVNTIFTLTSSLFSYCAGAGGVNLTLSGSESGISYQLKNTLGNDGAPIPGNGAPITWNNKTAQTYSVVATNTLTLCNMDMATSNGTNLTITENPSPIVNAGIDQTGCEGILFNLNATGASTYVWNTGSTAAGISVSPASTSTYSVTGIINATGCTATDAVIVNVNPLPLKYTVSGDGDYCELGAKLTVSLSNSQAGVNYYLLNNGVTDNIKLSAGGAITWPNKSAGIYTVRAYNANCNVLMNGSALISEVKLPNVYTLSGPTKYCSTSFGVTLTLSGSQIGYSYTLKNAGVTVGSIGGTGAALSWNNITTGIYTVEASTVNPISCPINMNGNITVATYPIPAVSAGADKTICKGQSVQLGASGGGTYTWTPAASLNNATVWNPIATPVSTTSYTVTVTDANSCNYTDVIQVTVRNLPVAVASSNTTICKGDFAILTATDNILGNGETYKWSTGSVNDTIKIYPLTTTTYDVTITDNGCSSTASTTVNVNPRPGINAGSDVNVCEGNDVILTGTGLNDINNVWNWSTGSPATSITVKPATTTNYTLTSTNNITNCINSDTVKVTVNKLPDVFTVTGGGPYCSNTPGVAVGLSSSTLGVSYELLRDTLTTGVIVSGTGAPITFGVQSIIGKYTVMARNSTSLCSKAMSGSTNINISPLPLDAQVISTATTSICPGTTQDFAHDVDVIIEVETGVAKANGRFGIGGKVNVF